MTCKQRVISGMPRNTGCLIGNSDTWIQSLYRVRQSFDWRGPAQKNTEKTGNRSKPGNPERVASKRSRDDQKLSYRR